MIRQVRSKAAAMLLLLALALSGAPTALAAPPTNDNFGDATVVPSLPFNGTVNNTEATLEIDEPPACGSQQTVWFSFTPGADTLVRADVVGISFGDTSLVVYQANGPGFGDLVFLNCTSFGGSITFSAQAGTTYYLQAGSIFCCGGDLQVNLQEILPPPNDNFAGAAVIATLPSNNSVDTTAATTETDEPTPACASAPSATAWYAFTPATSGPISASAGGSFFSTALAAYTGSAVGSLTQVGERCFGGLLTFHAEAGTTYYFQVGGVFGERGPLQFDLMVTPPPVASFSFSPSDPSAFDTIQFFDNSFDPGDVGIQSQAWDFGDGATATDCCPTHRYAQDGDYTVQLTVTTTDGRSASTSQVVQVRTHDVAITKFSAPKSASAGQTRQVTVYINSRRAVETVEVQIYKSVPGGYQSFGTLTQTVPARSANRTTAFSFNYTFTSDDASVGKVTFKAFANIIGARDALPADNEAIASPTKVSR